MDYNRRLRETSLRLAIMTVGYIITLCIYYHLVVTSYVVFLEMCVYLSISFILIVMTCFMDNLVKTIGNLLDEIKASLGSKVTSCPFHFNDREVTKIFELHGRLTSSIENFNESFGSIVLGIFAFIFGIGVFEIYYIVAAIFDPSIQVDFLFTLSLLGNFSSLVPNFIVFSRFGFTCESVQKKVSIFIH